MKIAWLMPNLHVTGGARVAVELSNQMVERGHEVSILIPKGRHKLQIDCKADVIECGSYIRSPLWTIPFAMLSMVGRLPESDVVMACMPPYALLARWIGRRRGIPAVDYVIGHDVRFFDDRTHIRNRALLAIYRAIARRSVQQGSILVNSHWTAVQVIAEGGVRPFGFVPHGFNPNTFRPDPEADGRPDKSIRFVTIGRMERGKGLNDLVTALNLLHNTVKPFSLTIISQDLLEVNDSSFQYEIVKPADDFDLVKLYQSSDVYVHSSWKEGFGIPPLEAQACGLAVVSTDCGGVREFLQDGDNALIVPPREPRTLAKAMRCVIEDDNLRLRIAQRGLETSIEFTWEKAADKLETALTGLIEDES